MAIGRTQDVDLGMSKVEHGETLRGVLEIQTGKGYSGGVMSDATFHWVGGGSRSCLLCGDFRKKVLQSARTVKATQKAIDSQHAEVFTPTAIETLVAEAKAFYAGKGGGGVMAHPSAFEYVLIVAAVVSGLV